jgi:small subunit ribosomal protein S16
MIVIRMSRKGRTNLPHFRVGVYDVRTRRDGEPVEYLGHYDPRATDDEKKVTLDLERIQYWMGQGARVTDTVANFLRKRGVTIPPRRGKKHKKASGAR